MRAEIYTVEQSFPGKLSIMARPRGGDWLLDEVKALYESGVEIVVSLLTSAEQQELDLLEEGHLCQEHHLVYWPLPISDRGTPPTTHEAMNLVHRVATALQNGQHVAIHCRMGIGRSAMIAASALGVLGVSPDEAFSLLALARGCEVPDTKEQRQWVEAQWHEQAHA